MSDFDNSTSENSLSAYKERLVPGPSRFISAAVLAIVLFAVLFPVSLVLAISAGVAAAAVMSAALIFAAPVVTVDRDELTAGTQSIRLDRLSQLTPLASKELSIEVGEELDTDAYLCFVASVTTAVRVDVAQPGKGAPYWIVSTRNPDSLIHAINRVRETPDDA